MGSQEEDQIAAAAFTLQQLQARPDPFSFRTDGALWPGALRGQPGHPVRVALVAATSHVRQVVAQELLADLRIDLVVQATGLREGKRVLGMREIDVLLVEASLADGSGLDLVAQLKARQRGAEAIVMSATDDEEQAMRAFDLGAVGWLVRTRCFGGFASSILQVANGGAAMTAGLVRRLLHRCEDTAAAAHVARPTPGTHLSRRETEVLAMVAHGLRSREIGEHLTITGETVNAHIRSIYRKLQVRSRAQAVRIATQTGLL